MRSPARLRDGKELAAQLAALSRHVTMSTAPPGDGARRGGGANARGEDERDRGRPPGTDFHRGAIGALRWLLEGGPGPLTGGMEGRPVSARAIVSELAAAEAIIYGGRSRRREYGQGVEHALMWAELATAAPPLPTRRSATAR